MLGSRFPMLGNEFLSLGHRFPKENASGPTKERRLARGIESEERVGAQGSDGAQRSVDLLPGCPEAIATGTLGRRVTAKPLTVEGASGPELHDVTTLP